MPSPAASAGPPCASIRASAPGLLEKTYQPCLSHELDAAGIPYRCEADLPPDYDGTRLDSPLHEAQVLTYLRLGGCRVGLLLSFNVVALKQGIRRLVL